MDSYYRDKLSAQRLKQCYDLAPPPVRRYLEAEIDHVRSRIPHTGRVLELGCGYGRVLREIAAHGRLTVGVDNSLDSLVMGRTYVHGAASVALAAMDATALACPARTFDVVCCVQNGISAFRVDQRALVAEAARVTRRGGRVLFSSYADAFWQERLEWFRLQARHGLVGEIDDGATRDGVIVCRDGFRVGTVRPAEFRVLAAGLGRRVTSQTVDGSSVFFEIEV